MTDALLKSGLKAWQDGDLDACLRDFTRALATEANHAIAYVYLGNYYSTVPDDDLAIRCYVRAQLLDPHLVDSYYNESNLHQLRRRFADAEAKLLAAIALDPANPQVITNFTAVRHSLGADALATINGYQRSLRLKSHDNHRASVNLGQAFLSFGRFLEGWPAFHSRFSVETPALKSTLPFYTGRKTDSKIIVWGEQGVGDQIMFLSMLNDLVETCPNVTFRGDRRLENLCRRTFPTVDFQSNDSEFRQADFDLQVALGDLGGILRNSVSDFPTTPGFMNVEINRYEALTRELHAKSSIMNVGLSWRSTNKDSGGQRTIDLRALLEALRQDNVNFIDLQYDGTTHETTTIRSASFDRNTDRPIEERIDRYNDLDGVACLSAACDLVISIGNTVAHISAAVGTETWVLVPEPPGWRWMASGPRTPWYPTVKIFRQSTRGSWHDVLSQVRMALSERLISRRI